MVHLDGHTYTHAHNLLLEAIASCCSAGVLALELYSQMDSLAEFGGCQELASV